MYKNYVTQIELMNLKEEMQFPLQQDEYKTNGRISSRAIEEIHQMYSEGILYI